MSPRPDICIIFNPAARGDKAQAFRQGLCALAQECVLKPTTGPGAGRVLAAEAVHEGCTTVVAAGGDGTLNEVLNGLADVPGALARTRLGLLPLGTVNVFAKELGLPAAWPEAWQVVRQGVERRLDLALATYRKGPGTEKRCFIQLAGAGLDARAIELVDWNLKKRFGPLAYVAAGFKALGERQPRVTVTAGEVSLTGELVLVGNGAFYGGRFRLFPGARLDDGRLDVAVFPRAGWGTILRFGWGWLTGRIPETCGVQALRAEVFTLTSPDEVGFEVEGEAVGTLPATLTVQRQAVRVLAPAAAA